MSILRQSHPSWCSSGGRFFRCFARLCCSRKTEYFGRDSTLAPTTQQMVEMVCHAQGKGQGFDGKLYQNGVHPIRVRHQTTFDHRIFKLQAFFSNRRLKGFVKLLGGGFFG